MGCNEITHVVEKAASNEIRLFSSNFTIIIILKDN
jgi:hypothetical protein